jgi:hypothetical protein
MWFYKGAANKGLLKNLVKMQRKAALWITGAFRTSPSGGIEALAGLVPIHLSLAKLAAWWLSGHCVRLRVAVHRPRRGGFNSCS